MDDEVSEDTIDLLAKEPERDSVSTVKQVGIVGPDAVFEESEEFLTIVLKKGWRPLSSLEVAGATSNMGSGLPYMYIQLGLCLMHASFHSTLAFSTQLLSLSMNLCRTPRRVCHVHDFGRQSSLERLARRN